MLRYVRRDLLRGPGLALRSPSGVSPFRSSGASGIAGAPLRAWRARAGSPARLPHRRGFTLRVERQGESVWVAPPALADARRVAVARVRRADGRSTGVLLARCRSTATGRAAIVAAAARGLRQPARGRAAGAARRRAAAPPPPRPAAHDRRRLRGHGAAACSLAACLAGGPDAPPGGVAAERDDLRARCRGGRTTTCRASAGVRAGLGRSPTRCGSSSDRYRACVPGRDPQRWLCLSSTPTRRPAGVTRDPSIASRTRRSGSTADSTG